MTIVKQSTTKSELKSKIAELIETHKLRNLEEVLCEMRINVKPSEDQLVDVSIEELKDYYFESNKYKGYSLETQKGYKSEFLLFTSFADKHLKRKPTLETLLDLKMIKDYLESYPNKYTNDRKRGFIRSFLGDCVKKFHKNSVDENIKDLRVGLKFQNEYKEDEAPVAMRRNQIIQILDRASATKAGFRNFTILMTFLHSGIRLNELVNIRIKDISPDGNRFKVLAKGAGGNRMTRYISALGYSLLQSYIEFTFKSRKKELTEEQYQDLYVFSASKKQGTSPISRRIVQIMFKDLINSEESISDMEKAKYTIHTLRHCFAIYSLEQGIDIYKLSKLLGHNSIQTTTIYLKLFDEQLAQAIEKHPFAKGFLEE